MTALLSGQRKYALNALAAYLISKGATYQEGITQQEIAEVFNASQPTVSRWLRSHPGFKRSIKPISPRGYWFDVTAEPEALSPDVPEIKARVETNGPRELVVDRALVEQLEGRDLNKTFGEFLASLGSALERKPLSEVVEYAIPWLYAFKEAAFREASND